MLQGQIQNALNAFHSANPDVSIPKKPTNQGEFNTYRPSTALGTIKTGAKFFASKAIQGLEEMGDGVAYLLNKIGIESDERLAHDNRLTSEGYYSNLGLEKNFAETGYDNRLTQGIGGLVKIAPAILGASETGGATWFLQNAGSAAVKVRELKDEGVKFDNHSDDLYVVGSGLIGYALGKGVGSTILSKMGGKFTNDIVGRLSAEAIKDVADLGAKATAEDVASVFVNKATTFGQRLAQSGLEALKAYPKIGTEFAAANLTSSALKAAVNAMNGDRKPLGEVTGDELANDISSPFYNGGTPNGNIKDFAMGLITSPAAGLSMLHLANSAGMLFDKSPYKNAVIESLQKDGSPENVRRVKDELSNIGVRKQWTDDEIANTNTTVDALADITSKIPSDIRADKFHDATNLVLGRRQLEAVLAETQARKEGLDPAIASKAAPFEALVKAKVEQANDKLDELITDKSYTYTEKAGKYFKSKLGEDPIEISKDRYDLEVVENKAKPKAEQSKVISEPTTGTAAKAEEKPSPSPEPSAPAKAAAPAAESSMLDDLDNELDNFKQPSESQSNKPPVEEKPIVESKPKTNEPTTENKPTTAALVKKQDPAATKTAEKVAAPVDEKPIDNSTPHKTSSETEISNTIDRLKAKISTGIYHVPNSNVHVRLDKDGNLINPVKHEPENDRYVDEKFIDDNHRRNVEYDAEKSKKLQDNDKKHLARLTDDTANVVIKAAEKFGNKKLSEMLENAGGYNIVGSAYDLETNPGKYLANLDEKLRGGVKNIVQSFLEPASEKLPDTEVKETAVKADKPYYVAMEGEHQETPGKPLPNDSGLDLFVHDLGDINGKGFGVSEGSTGLSIAKGTTEAEAISKAKEVIAKQTPAELKEAIRRQREDNGIKSPRGIVKASRKVKAANITPAEETEANELLKPEGITIKDIEDYEHDIERIGDQGERQAAGDNAEAVSESENDTKASAGEDTAGKGVERLQPGTEVDGWKPVTLASEIKELDKNMRNVLMLGNPVEIHGPLGKTSYRLAADGSYEKKETLNDPEPEPTNEPPKDEKQSKRAKFEQELKDAKEAFRKTFAKAMSGVNPETIEKGIRLLAVYAKIGIHDFKEIARDLAADLGEGIRDVFEGLKASYGAFATQEATEAQLDLMTDIREVRRSTVDEFLTKSKDNATGIESNPTQESTLGVDAGEPAGVTGRNVPGQQTDTLPGKGDGAGGKAGDAPARTGDEPGRDRQSGSGTGVGTGERGTGQPAAAAGRKRVSEDSPGRVVAPENQNHVIKPTDVIVPAGPVARFNANLDALFLLKKLEMQDRNPTPAEKKALAQFVGWGGLAKYLTSANYKDDQAVAAVIGGTRAVVYNEQYRQVPLDFTDAGRIDVSKFDTANDLVNHIKSQLNNAGYSITPDAIRAPLVKSILTTEEYQGAQNSTINAHYTEREIINNMWNIVEKLGFKGGRVLEPSAGIGHFFGLLPENLRNRTTLQGYELDSITGRLLKKLYPQANITVGGFEHSRVPVNSVDIAISNVPFAASAPYDKNFPELSKFSMHNYFIAKNLKLLKPGGVAAMITSSSTMDSPASAKFRQWVTSPEGGNSYLVGAMRFPNNAFSENAGTQVTTDLLIFQKRGQVADPSLEQPFRYTKFLKEGEDDKGNKVELHVNEYYHDHPEQMMGEMMTAHEAGSGGLYGGDSATLKAPAGFDINKSLKQANKIFPADIIGDKEPTNDVAPVEAITAVDKKEGSVFVKENKIYRVEDGDGKPMALDSKQVATAKAYVELKEGLLNLIKLEQSDVNAEANIEAQRKELNKDYDAFVKKHGNISNGRVMGFLNDSDIDFPIVSSLENVARTLDTTGGKNKFTDTITKGEILTKRINFPRTEPTKASDLKDAVNISLNFRSALDVNYMARMLGEEVDDVKDKLISQGLAFENPDSGILETPEEYLSGFVRDKLRKAESAVANDPKYANNVTQLKKIIPADIPSSLISYSLGSSWIPMPIYNDFAKSIFGGIPVAVKYLPSAGKFLVEAIAGRYAAAIQNTYAAGGLDGVKILDATLNNRQIVVSDKVEDIDGKTKTVKNMQKTAEAQAMQVKMQEDFEEYVRGSESVQQETERIYNDVFNGQVNRSFRIPEFKHYPDASSTITLNNHQKRGVSRGISESTLFAHEVGSGKTFVMITTAMEMRRLGTARKPMIAVQNATLGQFVKSFKKLYPGAKILAPTKREMQADGRKKLFAKIATGDWDAVILPHSQITMIPDDPERQKAYIREQIEEMKATMAIIGDKRESNKIKSMIEGLEKEIKAIDGTVDDFEDDGAPAAKRTKAKDIGKKSLSITAGMEKILDRKVDNVLNFEQLGVDALLVDEAHDFKKLGFQTSMANIKGIDTGKSQKAQSIYLKSRWVQEKTGGKNVNFYTGTPISNTMAEAWTMMRFLRPDILEHLGIEYFDQFAKTFGQVVPSLEQTAGGTFKIQSRFSKFQNLPEFINAFKTVADVVLTSDVKEFQDNDSTPKIRGGKPQLVAIPQSAALKKQIAQFRATLEWFDKLGGKEKREYSYIPLVTYTQAKKAAIDLRLLDPTNEDSPESKTNEAVKKIYEVWKQSKGDKGTQMVFSDLYQSPEPKNKYLDDEGLVVNSAYGKDRFNLLEDIKLKLVKLGVPANEIAIITESKYDKPERKNLLFDEFNAGSVRIALGTTQKMGVGVNAQERMVALHNLDVPQRPMEFIQRLGRIIRQGNLNKIVDILNYGVEKTLDASGYQTLASKEGFITQVMKGENLDRVMDDAADESSMGYEEMMAHLSDSPFAMQKLMIDNKLNTEKMRQNNFNQKLISTNSALRQEQSRVKRFADELQSDIKNAEQVRSMMPDGNITSFQRKGQPEVTEKFSTAADEYVQGLIVNFENSPTHYAKGGFEVNGIRVEVEIVNKEKLSKETSMVVNTPRLQYSIPSFGIKEDNWGQPLVIESNSGQGLITSIRSQLEKLLVKPSDTQRKLSTAEKDIEQLKKDAGAKFDASKLTDLQAQSDALKEQMIEEGKKAKPADEDVQSAGAYIKDQSNIKPALDFLDGMKAKNDGRFLSTIVPIPPAVWNGAIDVMKNILKATNSTQKAIRVAGKYIIDRGGTDAQAKDFESTMTDKMAGTKSGQKATTADTDEVLTEDAIIKAVNDIAAKIDSKTLSPDEQDIFNLDLKRLTKKELNRVLEIASVLSVDPQGVLTTDITDLMDRIANRLNPKSGTAVPPTTPPPSDDNSLFSDDEPRRRIPKKEKLPMDSIEDMPEQTDENGKPVAKENYSAWGRFKDIRVRNLEQLKRYSQDIDNMSPLRDVRTYATSKSQASIVMKTTTDRILKLVGKPGWDLLRQALVESRLRGIKERWNNWATQIKKSSDNEIDDLFENGKDSMMYDVIAKLDGYEDDAKPEQTILGMISNGEYDDAREYMSDMFANAGNNVAFFDKLDNGKTFDEIFVDGKFVDPKMQEAFEAYANLMATPFEESHASNEGVFSDALGPLDTYYPLVPVGKDAHKVVMAGNNKYKAPENPNNKFATGQGDKYSTALSDLTQRLSTAIRTNNKAVAIRSLENAGLIAKVSKESPDEGYISVNGETYTATKVLIQDARLIVTPEKTIPQAARYVLVPNWLYREIKPIFDQDKTTAEDFSLFGRIGNVGVKLMLGGPMEAASHSYRLLGGIVNSMPYMQEWAYKNGVLGQAGGLVLNNPFVKTFVGMGKILTTDIESEEALTLIQEMAKIGVIPEKTWQKTWSKEFAELTGAKKVGLWDFSPILYGKNSFDLKARLALYRLSKAMNPNATPEQMVTMQNELGNYTQSLQGEMEKFVKRHGIAPFYSFGGAIYRSGIRAIWGGTHLPLTRPTVKEAFTTKLGAEQMAKLAGYKMAQLLSAGVLGLVGYWALTYHAQTDKWPWEDKHSKLLKLPFPQWAKNEATAKMFSKKGKYEDIDMSFFNPFLNRGTRAVGAPKAYEAAMLGGTLGQSVEAGTVQAINTNISPYTSSPAIQIGTTALTGSAPYITGIRDKYSGAPGIGFYRKVNTMQAGAQIPANLAVAAVGINPLVDAAFSPVTKAIKYQYGDDDMDAMSAAKSVFNTIIPHLFTPHGNDDNKAKQLHKQEKAIQTSIKKEK